MSLDDIVKNATLRDTLKDSQFKDIDEIRTIQSNFFTANHDSLQNRSLIDDVLRIFLLIILVTEIVNINFKHFLQMKHAYMRNKEESGQPLIKVFIGLNLFQMLANGLIFNLTLQILIYSHTINDALNNSLSIIVLLIVPQMSARMIVMELSGYNNQIYSQSNYLQIEMASQHYKPLHFALQLTIIIYMFIFALSVWFSAPLFHFRTSLTIQ